jgi:hypothetical protein
METQERELHDQFLLGVPRFRQQLRSAGGWSLHDTMWSNPMPSKVLFAGAAFVLMGATTFPLSAQTPGVEGTQPETAAPEATPRSATQTEAPAPEVTAGDSDSGSSHRLTGAAVIFNLIDGDGDGAIDLEEATTLFEAFFTTLDADDDGKLSKSEINSVLRRAHGGHGGRGYRHHDEGDDYYDEEDD